MESAQSSKDGTESKSQPFAATISEQTLRTLRDQIKNAMIPLLIKIFRLKQTAQSEKTTASINELVQIDEDLKQLQTWCQSCRVHIQKALKEGDSSIPSLNISTGETHPALQSSITEALTAAANLPSLMALMADTPSAEPKPVEMPKKGWLKKIVSRLKN